MIQVIFVKFEEKYNGHSIISKKIDMKTYFELFSPRKFESHHKSSNGIIPHQNTLSCDRAFGIKRAQTYSRKETKDH